MLERAYVEHFVRPQLEALGNHYQIMKPWYFKAHGAGIHIGESIHVVTAVDRRVTLTTWKYGEHAGHIDIGDYCLLCPGTRLDSACGITIGADSMLAANVYVTDADWHDIYDRTLPIGITKPVAIGPNVWLGDSCIVCKGVSIGENSVIGAGSVVTGDIPANVIAAGNPARVIRGLDAAQPLRRRRELLADAVVLERNIDDLDRYLLSGNSWAGWVKRLLKPGPGD